MKLACDRLIQNVHVLGGEETLPSNLWFASGRKRIRWFIFCFMSFPASVITLTVRSIYVFEKFFLLCVQLVKVLNLVGLQDRR